MTQYEYRVVPAPTRCDKIKGAKTTADRFALTLGGLMNDLGRQGWEYLRAETLPCEERRGLTGRSTTEQNVLIFRRALPDPAQTPGARPAIKAENTAPPQKPADGDGAVTPALGPARTKTVPPRPGKDIKAK